MKCKSKCYATPKWAKTCDGCNTISTKCPYRYKERQLRSENKRTARKEAVRALNETD